MPVKTFRYQPISKFDSSSFQFSFHYKLNLRTTPHNRSKNFLKLLALLPAWGALFCNSLRFSSQTECGVVIGLDKIKFTSQSFLPLILFKELCFKRLNTKVCTCLQGPFPQNELGPEVECERESNGILNFVPGRIHSWNDF